MSLYKEAIKRYHANFKNVLVLNFEELFSKKTEVLKKVSTFLNIEEFNLQNTVYKNKGRQLRFKKLFYLLKKMGLKDYFSFLIPKIIRQSIYKMVSTSKKQKPELSPEVIQKLNLIFKLNY